MPFAGVPACSTAILRSRHAARLLWASHARGRAVCSSASGAMDPDVLAAVQAIHAGPTKAVFAVTGGGAQGVSWLLSVPGASGTVLEAVVPYSRPALADFLGREPVKSVSEDTARDLALHAYRRALRLSPDDADVAGVAVTAALVTASPKKGDHSCHVATHSRCGSCHYALRLAKGARDRAAEERVVSTLLIQAAADACGVHTSALVAPLIDPHAEEAVVCEAVEYSDPLGDLLAARVPVIQLQRGAVTAVGAASPRVLLPGSFNPVHDGHSQLLEAACAAVGGGATGGFELSVTNADKGALPRGEVERRAMQFAAGGHALVLTDAPLFVQKAALLPGTVFVVGVDTAVRIVMPKYYGGSEAAMLEVLHTIRRHNCSFLVAGRLVDGAFVEPTSVAAPPGLEGLFRSLPSFRKDISSTELRARAAQKGSQ